MVKAKTWVKLREFSGTPTKDDFKLVEENLPELKDGGRVALLCFINCSQKLTEHCQNSRLKSVKCTLAVFTNVQDLQYCHYCQLCIPIYLQFSSLLKLIYVSKCEII